MANSEINNYITKRYDRWLDYANFHCKQINLQSQAIDVLNEVLLSLLQKDTSKLLGLLHRQKDNYTELDWFVIRMINLNIKSPTSPFRRKALQKNIDENTNPTQLQIIDHTEEENDIPGKIFLQMSTVREVLESLPVSDIEKEIFSFRFFLGEPFRNWQGVERSRVLYSTYHKVESLIKEKIQSGYILTKRITG